MAGQTTDQATDAPVESGSPSEPRRARDSARPVDSTADRDDDGGTDRRGSAGWTAILSAAGIGSLGVGYAVGYALGSPASLLSRMVTVSLPVVVSLLLLVVSVGLYRGRYEVEYDLVLRWGVLGVVTTGILGSWFPVARALGSTPIAFSVLLTISAGALGGVLLGLYNSQRVRIGQLERYETIVESVRDGVFAVDDDGTVTLANPAMAELVGVDRTAVTGRDLDDFATELLDIDGPSGNRATADISELAGREPVEVTVTPVDRGSITCELDVESIDPGDARLVGVLRDVSRYERLRQQLSVTNRVLRHNLRTSTNLIAGQARIVEVDATEEGTIDRARAVRVEAERLGQLADKARILGEMVEAGYGSKLVDADPAAVVADGVAPVRNDHDRASFEVTVPEGLEVRAHPQMARGITEAVENAVVHADVATPTVRITVRPGERLHELRIADEGPGIPYHERAVLESQTETDLSHGSGLGLWLVRWLVDISNGDLCFEETDVGGTVVVIRLPAVRDGTVDDPGDSHQNGAATSLDSGSGRSSRSGEAGQ